MIKRQTAAQIAYAYAEIDAAEKLLEEIEAAKKDFREPDFRDGFGRRRGLTLGVPSGDSGQRILDLSPTLGAIIIRAHIDQKRSEITALCETARVEMHVEIS